jgi:hypothetical protein
MPLATRTAFILLSIGTAAILGCSGGSGSDSKAQVIASKPGKVPQAPEAVGKAILDGLRTSKPIVVWNYLGTASQNDLNKLVRETAATIDREAWSHSVRTLRKIVSLMETKQAFLLASPLLKATSTVSPAYLKANWSSIVSFLKTVAESELVDRQKMENFDGQSFFSGTGARLYAQARELSKAMKGHPLQQIDDTKVSVKQPTDASAVLVFQFPDPKAKPLEIPLILRDGEWSPALIGFAVRYVDSKTRQLLDPFRPYALVEWKDQYLRDLDHLDKAIDELQSAKTSDAFQAVFAQGVLPIALRRFAQFTLKPKRPTGLNAISFGRPQSTAMVVIKGRHTDDEPLIESLSKVFDSLSAQGNGSAKGPVDVDGVTVFLVSPVTDTNAFARKIVIGKVIGVDAKRNTVTAELPAAPQANAGSIR